MLAVVGVVVGAVVDAVDFVDVAGWCSAQKRPSAVLWSRTCAPSLNAVNPIYIAPASREKPALLYVLARFVRVIHACDVYGM